MAITDLFANGHRPNIVLIITDQQRALQHWSPNFIEQLPALRQLMNTGVSFERAFTATCACAPSRATFLTSTYPGKHGVKKTGQLEPPVPLNPELVNLAQVLARAGYNTRTWRGKWHLGGNGPDNYGFTGWRGPDAGITISDYNTLGGGKPDYDNHYLTDMLDFVGQQTGAEPFCLVASFVNPHDGFVAHRGLTLAGVESGYTLGDFTKTPIFPPANMDGASLAKAPRAQFSASWWNPNLPASPHTPEEYINFYAYLHTLVDAQVGQLLNRLTARGLLDDTLIVRFADHGEMGLSHGLVEKFFNAYEESIRVPLVFSNPRHCTTPQATDSLASLVDLVPTLASLLGVAGEFSFDGKDLSPVLAAPQTRVQDAIHFTYDDNGGAGPSVVRTIRTAEWKYSVYFNKDGTDADWELYHLVADPNEDNNVAGKPAYAAKQAELEAMLQATMVRLGTMPSFPNSTWPPQKTANSRGV